MPMQKQRTLAKEVTFTGKGLHIGEECTAVVRPAPAGTGLTITVGDKTQKLRPGLSDGSRNANMVRLGPDTTVMTVEHMLSAIWGMGIDNAAIEITGQEAPALDGSALEFATALRDAGIVEQEADRKVFVPKHAVSVGTGDTGVAAYPSKDGTFRVTYVLDYKESPLARGTVTVEVTPEGYIENIAPARTFVMRQHVEPMLAAGLGKGANAQNTLVLDGDSIVDNAMRLPDECVRHKILDLVGDLSILNRRLGVHIVASKSGHALNIELARAMAREISKAENPAGVMEFKDIVGLLPHRYPFLLVDRVLELEERKYIQAAKNLTFNEEFFQGHFPGQPIMPGVLQIEALSQAGAIMMLGEYRGKGKIAVLMSADDVKWRRQVVPGDVLLLNAEFVRMRGNIGIVKAWGTVDGDVTTEATIKFAVIDANRAY